MLRLYQKVRSGIEVTDEANDPVKNQLKLSGLLKTEAGKLVVRNRIYAAVFDEKWIKARMPFFTTTRITWAAILVSVVALIAGGILLYRMQNSEQIQAAAFSESFISSQSSPVRLSSLAGLFNLPGYEDEARRLFFELPPDQQRRLFTELDNPAQVGTELQIVIKGVYTHLDAADNRDHTRLLEAMLGPLTSVEEARLLTGEIEAWLEGRHEMSEEEENEEKDDDSLEEAIEAYTRALSYNENNPAVYLDRALAQTRRTDYHQSLADFNQAVVLSQTQTERIVAVYIRSNRDLREYLAQHSQEFPTLAEALGL